MDVLREFREEPLPPSGVDVARAVRAGRRRRRARLGLVAAGLVAVVTAGAATAPQWRPYLPGPTGPDRFAGLVCDPAAPLPAHVPPPVEPGQAPAAFDLMRYWLRVDDVTAYQTVMTATSRLWQLVELTDPTSGSAVEIVLYARGVPPVFSASPGSGPKVPVDPTSGTPAAPVDGAPAYWLPGRQGYYQFEAARLGWQWAPDAWAFVAAADRSSQPARTAAQLDDLRQVARQVADKVHIGQGASVTSPFTTPVPDCTRLVETRLVHSTNPLGTPYTQVALIFGTEDFVSQAPLTTGGTPLTTVASDSVARPSDRPGPMETVDGHPARYDAEELEVYDVDGFALLVHSPGGRDAALAIYRQVSVIPGAHASPTAWTPTPLR